MCEGSHESVPQSGRVCPPATRSDHRSLGLALPVEDCVCAYVCVCVCVCVCVRVCVCA